MLIKRMRLDEDQMAGLLELAQVHFPSKGSEDIYIDADLNVKIPRPNFSRDGYETIPWYEFVMTWLADKIFFPDNKPIRKTAIKDLENFLTESQSYWLEQIYDIGFHHNVNTSKHPVTLLYNRMTEKV